ncbi:MAG TPA: CotH kinase family protein [Chitinophagaceae bacterium]|nr:CotH kinase family protein [Chitinophagaceae bacterium]
MKKLLTFIILLSLSYSSFSQCGGAPIHHWESCVLETTSWKYIRPTNSIPNWYLPIFNDASWLNGIGGIGYGDGDDNTNITNPTTTVYMRKSFNIVDTALIKSAVFCMDYDDGFVAYLNGKEFARANMGANQQFNTLALSQHEANIYQGIPADYFIIPPASLDTLLVNGTNLLSIEVHNATTNSPDLSSRPFLQLAILNATFSYSPTPSWFIPPTPLETNLPIISINTLGQTIVDDPRIICDMGIIYNGVGAMNCISDPFNNYNGKISIEYRGSTSQGFPKKPYGFSTVDALGNNLDSSLLGYPKEHDWILLNPYTDKTFMRDALIYDLGRALNWYASRTKFVELVINGINQGVYVLLEKIKRDDDRVDIGKITPTANSGDSLTGGYIFKVDKFTGTSGGAWTTSQGISIQPHDPNYLQITSTQTSYLQNYINNFETSLWSSSFADPNTGYRKFANVYSFADFFILNEVSNNIDGYRLSSFIHKDRNSKCGRFTMGPLWDFNLSFGNGDYCNGYPFTGWQLYQGCGLDGSGYWMNRMLQDQWFKNLLNCRWNELRQTTLSTASLLARIDTNANYLRQASVRDSAIWQTLGNYIWPNGWVANTWQGEIDSMKLWLTNRLNWMDANMYPSTQNCFTAAGLNLVIDEINFNSDSTISGGDWIELYNYGTTAINISNAVILDGDQYEKYCVIPNNTIINAGQRLVVYEDSIKFANRYPTVTNKIGPLCFKLSNEGQKLVMRDKDNKLITSVTYDDEWQCASDGNGRTLQLLNTSSTPNNAASWYAGCIGGSPGVAYTSCVENPIYTEINYSSAISKDAGDWIEIHNKNATPFSLSGWTVRDGSNSNLFSFPSGYSLDANKYIVLYEDAVKFNSQFPSVTNKLGPMNFALSATGDVIRLYDNGGKLKYSVCYSPNSPWPTTPNGGGKTLENGQYSGNHNAATSWFAGCPQGSPGFAYNPNCYPVGMNIVNENISTISVYPNPSSSILFLQSSNEIKQVSIMDILGREVIAMKGDVNEINIDGLPIGNYLLKCSDHHQTYLIKFSKK